MSGAAASVDLLVVMEIRNLYLPSSILRLLAETLSKGEF